MLRRRPSSVHSPLTFSTNGVSGIEGTLIDISEEKNWVDSTLSECKVTSRNLEQRLAKESITANTTVTEIKWMERKVTPLERGINALSSISQEPQP